MRFVGNTRLYEAVLLLVSACGDVRHRVASACRVLSVLEGRRELTSNLQQRLDKVLQEASKNGPLRNHSGHVIVDAYDNTLKTRQNKTYQKLAIEIFDIYKCELDHLSNQ
jgi:hypothetical protein